MSTTASVPHGLPVLNPFTKTVDHPGWQEFRTSVPKPESGEEIRRACEELQDGGTATVIGVDLFGSREQIAMMEKEVRKAGIGAPVTSILSTSLQEGGLQMTAVSGIKPEPLVLRDTILGYHFQDEEARYCFLGGLKPEDVHSPRERQTEEVFSSIDKALALAGMGFEHVVRTWFYNEKILEWYHGFNRVRTGYFQNHSIRRMPASTGIGAPNPVGTALVAKAIAVLPSVGGTVRIHPVRSPLQCDAFAYGSAFSRAMEVSDSHSRTLYISGTASIEPGGKSVHMGDPAAQIALTMDVVHGILGKASMRLEDSTRVVAYFRDPAHIPVWEDYCRRHALPPLPSLAVGCYVCRDDLLFEIEIDVSVEN